MAILDFDISKINLPNNEKGTAISLTGSIDATTNQQFEQELTEILSQGVRKVILVLRGIKYINSTGLGTIVKCVDTFREVGGDIKMVGIPTKVIALFEMLGLLALFETYDDLEEAISSFTKKEAEAGEKRVKQEYPVQLKCTSCGAGVNIKGPGKYKCAKCGDYFSAEDDGTVETYAIKKPNVIQIQIPCDESFSESIKSLVTTAIQRFGIPDESITQISSSLDEFFSILKETSTFPNDSLHVLIVADKDKFSIGFVNYSSVLDIPDDNEHIGNMRSFMDEVEIIGLPIKGHLLKMNKVLR